MLLFDTFKDTIFLKEDSTLEKQRDALNKLLKEYSNREDIVEELYLINKGIAGEKEIKYQLSKSNIGMYVLHDVNLQNADLKAQVDYIIITKVCAYFIECKNLVGNITINERGDFIREFVINSKKIKKGMYSPIRQVEAQRDVFRKIWESNIDGNVLLKAFKKYYGNKNFNDNYRVLVVTANNETILNTRYAPKDIKNKVIRSDALIRKIEEDIKYSDRNLWLGKKEMESWASSLLSYNVSNDIDYYDYYKNKFIKEKAIDNDNLKNKLINFRKERSASMNIPAYYVFTNEELDKLVELKPKDISELKSILTPIKIKTHGNEIINIIKENK